MENEGTNIKNLTFPVDLTKDNILTVENWFLFLTIFFKQQRHIFSKFKSMENEGTNT